MKLAENLRPPLVKQQRTDGAKFERQGAEHHGVKHCIAMWQRNRALEIAIRALELEGRSHCGRLHLHSHRSCPELAAITPGVRRQLIRLPYTWIPWRCAA